MRHIAGMALLVLLTGACGDAGLPAPAKDRVDLLLHGGQVLTMDDAMPSATAVAVRGDRIAAVGGEELLTRLEAARVINLAGKTVMPGFNDTHVHINGKPDFYIELSEVASIAELQALVQAKAATLGPGAWITGYGWSEDQLSEGRRPLRDDLDAVAPDNPVMLTRAGAHSAVFNSPALELAGITAATPDPDGGTIERGPDGELNGIIRERHEELVGRLVPEPSWESLRPSLVDELKQLFSLGITSLTHANADIDYFAEWAQVYSDHPGELPRASVQVFYEGADAMTAFGRKTGDGDDFLKVGPIKIFADGGFTGPAAFTKRPYKGEDTYRGALNMRETVLANLIDAAHRDGWQLGIHAIGDAAIELVVAQLATTLQASPRPDHRHYLNHFTVMPDAATMQTMAENGIAITQQPNFLYTLEGRYVAYLDGERLAHNNPMATPMSHGVHVAMSSDILPLGPWVGIYAATTRRGPSGTVHGAEEKISRLAALAAYTTKGAYLNREEHIKGKLAPGYWADFIVLDDDPLTVPDEALLDMSLHATYLAGRRVFSASPAP